MISRRQFISGSAGPIFTIFHRMKAFGCRSYGNRFCEKWQTPHFRRYGFRNGMGYHYHNVRLNSENYVSTSCENFVKFGAATPELTELICERLVQYSQKTGLFSRISPNVLDRFSQSYHMWKPFMCGWWTCTYFPICQGSLPWQWHYVHSLHVRQMVARFCFATSC